MWFDVCFVMNGLCGMNGPKVVCEESVVCLPVQSGDMVCCLDNSLLNHHQTAQPFISGWAVFRVEYGLLRGAISLWLINIPPSWHFCWVERASISFVLAQHQKVVVPGDPPIHRECNNT